MTDISFILQSILLGFGLAMDSFSVSIADTLVEPKMTKAKGLGIAGMFGFCQMLFPVIGWFFVHSLLSVFYVLEEFIPWIALALLAYIGGKMIKEGITDNGDADLPDRPVTFPQLVMQGIATAIDALSVGFTIAEYEFRDAFLCAFISGAVTFLVCIGGLKIGKKLGEKIGSKASILGGCILIFIGLKVVIDSFI